MSDNKRFLTIGLCAGAATALSFMSADVRAQEITEVTANGTTVLPTVVIEGKATGADADGVDGYVPETAEIGSKSATPVQKIPQSVSVIPREMIDDQGAQDVSEALRYSAGVFTQPYGPDSDTNWFFMRGFDATQTGSYLDGLQLFAYGFGAFYVDSFTLDRIDVLRGPASVLYGGSNPGGIVNYVSKKPTGERLRYTEVGINDAGTAYFGFDIGDQINENFDYRVNGRIQGGEGYFDHQEGLRGTVSPSLTWRPNDSTSLTFLANITSIDETHGAASFLPYEGTVTRAPWGYIDRDKNFTEPDLDDYSRNQVSLGYEFEHEFENEWKVRQNARFGYVDVHEYNLYPGGYDGSASAATLKRWVFEHDTTLTTFLLDNQLEGSVQTGALDHNLLVGADYQYFGIDQVQASAAGTTISAINPVYGAAQATPSAYIDQELDQHRFGVYAQDRIEFGEGWTATFNGRYDYVTTDATGNPTYSGSDSAFSGRAGLAYEFQNGLTPYASVATFFNPLIGSSSNVDFYKPETGEQFEVGLKYKPTWLNGFFTASYFDLTRRNIVGGSWGSEIQIGEVNSRGFEFEAQANITENLRMTAAFTTYDLEITDDTDTSIIGKTPNIAPEQLASVFFDYTIPEGTFEGVTLGGGVRYQGASWADNANTLKVPDATLFDAKVGYERDNWGVNLNVTNIADTRYVASCKSSTVCSYGDGRSFKLRMFANW